MVSKRRKEERRQTPGASCRLHCRIAMGREFVRSRIIDVSEGGLCLISPKRLEPKQALDLSIDVPGTGQSKVRVEIWHVRRAGTKASGGKFWMAGAILIDADQGYERLLRAAGVAPTPPPESAFESTLDSIEPKVYRIRCKATGGPRTRVLTLAADSEEEARSLAVCDLGDAWTVLEIRPV